jgi:hypothetical protein
LIARLPQQALKVGVGGVFADFVPILVCILRRQPFGVKGVFVVVISRYIAVSSLGLRAFVGDYPLAMNAATNEKGKAR